MAISKGAKKGVEKPRQFKEERMGPKKDEKAGKMATQVQDRQKGNKTERKKGTRQDPKGLGTK